MKSEPSVEATLKERGRVHGPFDQHSVIAQELKAAMRRAPGWAMLSPDAMEGLEMIQHKVARILNKGWMCADSWHDVAGYAVLVEKRLRKEGAE